MQRPPPEPRPFGRVLWLLALVALPQRSRGGCPMPPPDVKGTKLTRALTALDSAYVGMVVTYDCVRGYRRVPGTDNSIRCGENLQWSQPSEFCKVYCPLPPYVNGAKLKPKRRRIVYFPDVVVVYDCIEGFKRVPGTENSVRCGDDAKWSQADEFCKVSCPSPPVLHYAKVKGNFEEYFPVGKVIEYDCNQGFKRVPGTGTSILCHANLTWSKPEEFCTASCPSPPVLHYAKVKGNFEEYFPVGKVIEYDCNQGFKHVPGTGTSILCHANLTWSKPEEFCTGMQCDDPVIEHGIKLTGSTAIHIHGNEITLECNIGYFMIGSYLIRCGENNTWNPAVPSCKKITAQLCGVPLVPRGSVHPLERQYEIGTSVVIQCNPQHSFLDETIEMSTVCQGHNLWEPPVDPCLRSTLRDTSVLNIFNGRIIHGKKKKYKPGDNISVVCFAGYTLRGPSVVQYIGGKKWSPKIPYCSLSVFFILLIAAIIFFVLLVAAKTVYMEYSPQGGSTPWT